MTDRDHFAAAALTGLLARSDVDADPLEHSFCCEDAYRWADAMLRERERTNHDAAPAAIAEPCGKSDAQHPSAATLPQPADQGLGTGDTQEPVAWAVVYPNDEVAVIAFKRQDADERATASDSVVPLYRQPSPTLTAAEREAVEWCVSRPQTHWLHGIYAATLRGLLERMK